MDGMMRALAMSFIGLAISLTPAFVSIILSGTGLAGTTAAYLLDSWLDGFFSLNLIFAIIGVPITLVGLKNYRKESRKRARLFSWRESVHEAELSIL
ncbi:MAG: hypothetical protein QXI52_04920 [Nitrososphaerota archaeon]